MTRLVAVDYAKLSAKRILALDHNLGLISRKRCDRRRLPEHIANTLMQQQRVSS